MRVYKDQSFLKDVRMIHQVYNLNLKLKMMPLNLLFFIQQLNVFYVYHLQSFIHYQEIQYHLKFYHHLQFFHYCFRRLISYKQVHQFHPFILQILHEYLHQLNHLLNNHRVLLISFIQLELVLIDVNRFEYFIHFMHLAFLFS